MYPTKTYRIKGVAPTLMHNGQLANPFNKWKKAIAQVTGKRKKSDEDYAEISRLEWYGSLYLDDKGRPCWPGVAIRGLIESAAKKHKQGDQVRSGVWVEEDCPLIYSGPKTPDGLWKDGGFVDCRTAKTPGSRGTVLRTRPIFREWELAFTVSYDAEIVNESDLDLWVQTGTRIGLSDYRPTYGRYIVVEDEKQDG